MTQPAKVQEPSMEEILASIRRIIADDEAKPAAAEKPAAPAPSPAKPAPPAPAAKAPVMNDIPPSTIAPPKRRRPPKPRRRLRTAAAASRARAGRDQQPGRYRRDAGRPRRGDVGGRDTPADQPDGDVFELTDEMAVAEPGRRRQPKPAFQKVEPDDDVEFAESGRAGSLRPPPGSSHRRSKARRRSRSCRARPFPRSNRPSTASPIPC